MTRATSSADRRLALYRRRVTTAGTERTKVHALVWWWMAEVRRLPDDERQAECQRLEKIANEMNGRSRS